MLIDLIVLGVVLIFVAGCAAYMHGSLTGWVRQEWQAAREYTFKPTFGTNADPRCQRTLLKLHEAREEMKLRGTRLLMKDRVAWQRINPMGIKPAATKVIYMRGRQ